MRKVHLLETFFGFHFHAKHRIKLLCHVLLYFDLVVRWGKVQTGHVLDSVICLCRAKMVADRAVSENSNELQPLAVEDIAKMPGARAERQKALSIAG